MNLSQKVALILGPSLAIVFLFAGYWVKTHQLEADAPLELHAGVPKVGSVSVPPPSGAAMDVSAPSPLETPDLKEASDAAAPVPPAPPVPVAPAVAPPKFDIVRVEPAGDAVVAGHTEPNSQVAVLANGKIIAEGKSDAAGQFVLLPPPLTPGDYALALQVTPPAGPAIVSDQNVAVSVPVKGQGEVMVALAEPGKATVLLADPTAKEVPPKADTAVSSSPKEQPRGVTPPAKPEVSIKTVEIAEQGGFFATGRAALNAHLRLYLNGSALVDVTAGADGQWSVKIVKGLVPGHYAVRADQIDASGKVVARAEVPFDYTAPQQAEVATAASSPLGSPAPKAPEQGGSVNLPSHQTADAKPAGLAKAIDPAAAVVNEIQTATVEKGNSLWRISRGMLGRGIRYTEIYAANAAQIRDPKLIYPGQVFVIPGQTN